MPTKDFEKRTLTEKRHSSLMADALRKLEFDVFEAVATAGGLPDEWHQIVADPEDTMLRDKITMRLDRDVVRFFKAMGPGYQMKMARVLRAWMHGRLAKIVEGPDTTDIVLRPEVVAETVASIPYWGQSGAAASVKRFVEGAMFYQQRHLARQEGEELTQDEDFAAEILEAAIHGAVFDE